MNTAVMAGLLFAGGTITSVPTPDPARSQTSRSGPDPDRSESSRRGPDPYRSETSRVGV